MKVLKINASVKPLEASVSRQLVEEVVGQISDSSAEIIDRDVTQGISQVTGEMVGSYFTPADQRSEDQKNAIAESDTLVAELQEADALVIGLPIYNFGVTGAMKAYFDLLARVGVTFRYTETGPEGLLQDRPTYIVVASGGTPLGSAADFATGHIKQFLNFLGIQDIHFIDATGLMMDEKGAVARAKEQIAALGTEVLA
ncbi:MAG: NAD(P)H-dependent oxidoreductase [Bacteroidota bacterium]